MLDYKIVVPSRRRSHNMKKLLSLVPTACVTVEDCEVDDYVKAGVPEAQILPHPKLTTIGAIRQWVLDTVSERSVVQIDDDFQYITCLCWARARRITDPQKIIALIENGVVISNDLGIDLFAWAHVANPTFFNACQPFTLSAIGYQAFIVTGRNLKFETEGFNFREDDDLNLQAFLKSRVIVKDARFYWNFGQINEGAGGCQGQRNKELLEANNREIKEKWGKYVQIREAKGSIEEEISIKVDRKSPLAVV